MIKDTPISAIETMLDEPVGATPSRRRSRGRKVLAGALALVVVVALAAGGTLWAILGAVDHFGDPFGELGDRPSRSAGNHSLNVLLLGSDSRVSAGDPAQWRRGAQRTDAIMILHVPGDRNGVYGVSIPRDSWVEVPGYGEAKINAAFAEGGPGLLVETVEEATGIYIDHVAVTDFESFAQLTDSLGGVEIHIPESTYDRRRGETIPAGTYHMNGNEALDYVRQRYGLPGGDLDRVQRQQYWVRQLLASALERDVASDPVTLANVVSTVSRSVSVDDSFTVAAATGLAISLRGVGAGDLQFLTVPVEGLGRSPDGRQSVVLLDENGLAALGSAMSEDRLADYLAEERDRLRLLTHSVN